MSVKTWISDLHKLADPSVIVVVGNKSDLEECRQVAKAGFVSAISLLYKPPVKSMEHSYFCLPPLLSLIHISEPTRPY